MLMFCLVSTIIRDLDVVIVAAAFFMFKKW